MVKCAEFEDCIDVSMQLYRRTTFFRLTSFSQSGFIFLQCPHQGARNLTNACTPVIIKVRERGDDDFC